jgi:hypothetical protein
MASQTALYNETNTLFCVFDVFLYENRFQGDLQNLMSFLQVWFGLGVYCHFRGCRGRDWMVGGFTTTCAIGAYHQ